MLLRLQWLFLSVCGLLCAFASDTAAQSTNTITTGLLPVSSICPSSQLAVSFTRTGTYNSNNVFTVQLSDGGAYADIPTSGLTQNGSTYTVTATIPATAPAGTTFRIRVNASNPAVVGSPSITGLTVKTKPGVPVSQSIQYGCQFSEPTSPATLTTYLFASGILPNSQIRLYDDAGLNTAWSQSIYYDNMGNGGVTFSNENVNANPYTKNFYFTQTVNSCESDRVSTKLTILPRPRTGPSITVGVGANLAASASGSRLIVCQNSILNSIGASYASPPHGFSVSCSRVRDYTPGSSIASVSDSYIPPTDVAGIFIYRFSYIPIGVNTGCSNTSAKDSFLEITVNPKSSPPTVFSAVNYCQNALAYPLTAQGQNLKWYDDNGPLPGPPTPATNQPGTVNYAVTQTTDGCESDVARFVVTVTGCTCLSMYTVKPGNWTDPTVWSCNRIPTNIDVVQVKHNLSVPAGVSVLARQVTLDANVRIAYETGARLQLGL